MEENYSAIGEPRMKISYCVERGRMFSHLVFLFVVVIVVFRCCCCFFAFAVALEEENHEVLKR